MASDYLWLQGLDPQIVADRLAGRRRCGDPYCPDPYCWQEDEDDE